MGEEDGGRWNVGRGRGGGEGAGVADVPSAEGVGVAVAAAAAALAATASASALGLATGGTTTPAPVARPYSCHPSQPHQPTSAAAHASLLQSTSSWVKMYQTSAYLIAFMTIIGTTRAHTDGRRGTGGAAVLTAVVRGGSMERM
jgi:hypothetical protein